MMEDQGHQAMWPQMIAALAAIDALDYLDFRFTDAPWLPAMPALRL